MNKIKKILVPTDFSKEANCALAVAGEIAERTGAEITLLHVLDIPVVGHYDSLDITSNAYNESDDPTFYQQYMAQLMRSTKGKMQKLREKHKRLDIKEQVVFDSFQKHIASFVIENETDLIVIGSKGISGLDEIFVGSNTEKVIRTAKVPVLTVKNYIENFDPRKIVFASDFSNISSKQVEALKNMQAIFMAEIVFVKIITPNTFETTTDTIKLINDFANKYHFEDFEVKVFNYYTEEEGIRAFGQQEHADILALSTHGRKGFAHLLFGSIAEEVANHASLPVLTFNQHFIK